MRIEYSPTGQALYLRFRSGVVAETVEVEELVAVDLDAAGEPLGIEFVVAEDFFPFLARHAPKIDGLVSVDLPEGLTVLVREQTAVVTT